jgi:hypothetical protein
MRVQRSNAFVATGGSVGAELFELSGAVIMIIVSGKLTFEELTELQDTAKTILQKHDTVRILALAEDFQGWEKSEGWGDLDFQQENDAKIERMALVGDPKWKELLLAFVGRGFREFPIEYFAHGEVAKARAWLRAK